MCWSAPVAELKYGRKLRRARGIGAGSGPTPQAFALVRVAEDKRFELLKGCPQHAFQVCGSVFTVGRRLRPAVARPRVAR